MSWVILAQVLEHIRNIWFKWMFKLVHLAKNPSNFKVQSFALNPELSRKLLFTPEEHLCFGMKYALRMDVKYMLEMKFALGTALSPGLQGPWDLCL